MRTVSTRTAHILQLVLVGGSAACAAYLYPSLPEQMVSHWNAAGQADGTTTKLLGVSLLPAIILVVWGLSVLLPKIDPLGENIEKFRGAYNFFFVALNLFFAYVFGLMLAWNLGARFEFGAVLTPALAALMWAVSLLLYPSKRNWFVGIRTPWTMQSDHVWETTHRLGAFLFKLSAIIILVGTLFPTYMLWFVFVPLVGSVVVTTVYSYIEFRREVR